MEAPPRTLTDIMREVQAPQRKREREPLVWTWAASLVGIVVALLIDLALIYFTGWTVVKLLSLNAPILGLFSIVGFGFNGLLARRDMNDLWPEDPLRNAWRAFYPARAGFIFAFLATGCQLVAVILT